MRNFNCRTLCALTLLGLIFLTIRCATTQYVLEGERAFSQGDFHSAHLAFEKAIKTKEKLPSFMSTQLLDERFKSSRDMAAQAQIDKGKEALKAKNYIDYAQAIEILTKFYSDQEDSAKFLTSHNEFHEKAVTTLQNAESSEEKGKALEELLKYTWYQTNRDLFYARYQKVVSPIHKELYMEAFNLYTQDKKYDRALKTIDKALVYLPQDAKTLQLQATIQQEKAAEQSRSEAYKLLRNNKHQEAITHLENVLKAYPKDEQIQAQLNEAKTKHGLFLISKGEKECEKKHWWKCREIIEDYKNLRIELERQDVILSHQKEADWEIGKELYEKAKDAWENDDPATAMLWMRIAKSLGESVSAVESQKLEDELNQLVKYKIGLYPANLNKIHIPVDDAPLTVITKLHERFVADPEFGKSVTIMVMDQKNADIQKPDAYLRGQLSQFKIDRKITKEKRTAKYIHHQESHPNPEYVNSQKRVIAAEGERDAYFKKVQDNQEVHDKALNELKEAQKGYELDRAAYTHEKIECDNNPTEKDLKKSEAELQKKITEYLQSGQDDQVGGLIAKWREEKTLKTRPCELPKFEIAMKKSQDEASHLRREYEAAKKVLDESKEYYLRITNNTFDAEIDHKAISQNLTVNVMETFNYDVAQVEADGKLSLSYELQDTLTNEKLVKAEASVEHSEKDFATDEVGVTPPEYEYQVIEEAHEPKVKDDVEMSQFLIDDATQKVYDQLRYGLAFHGRRFVKAVDKAKDQNQKIKYAVLTIYAKNYLIDPKVDTQKMKALIQEQIGYDWDKNRIDFGKLHKYHAGKGSKVSLL